MDLLAAAAQGDTHTITSLLNSKSIDINFQNKVNGWTALHWACKKNHVPAIKLLIAHGAKCIVNFNNQTPLDVAQDPQGIKYILPASTDESIQLVEQVINELSESSLQKILSNFKINSKNDLIMTLKRNSSVLPC